MKDEVNGSGSAVLLMTFVFFCLRVLVFCSAGNTTGFHGVLDGWTALALIRGGNLRKETTEMSVMMDTLDI